MLCSRLRRFPKEGLGTLPCGLKRKESRSAIFPPKPSAPAKPVATKLPCSESTSATARSVAGAPPENRGAMSMMLVGGEADHCRAVHSSGIEGGGSRTRGIGAEAGECAYRVVHRHRVPWAQRERSGGTSRQPVHPPLSDWFPERRLSTVGHYDSAALLGWKTRCAQPSLSTLRSRATKCDLPSSAPWLRRVHPTRTQRRPAPEDLSFALITPCQSVFPRDQALGLRPTLTCAKRRHMCRSNPM